MIVTPTAFVLGAGASVPYGFPTSATLRQRMLEGLAPGYRIDCLLRQCDQQGDHVSLFYHEFRRSALTSIDLFIGLRPKFKEVGELAIAAVLAPLEQREHLSKVNEVIGNGDWYQMLWNMMVSGVKESGDLAGNKINIITFNYDRSLEQFLLDAIASTFGLCVDEAYKLLTMFGIHHVYGSLGEFLPGIGYSYGVRYDDVEAIRLAQKSIHTIPANRPPCDQIASESLAKAQRCVVMGFSFDRTNCCRINLRDACLHGGKQEIYANCYHLTNAEIRVCESNAQLDMISWSSHNCMDLLRDRIDVLT